MSSDELREQVRLITTKGTALFELTQKDLCANLVALEAPELNHNTGVSTAALSLWLNRKYPGDSNFIEVRLRLFFKRRKQILDARRMSIRDSVRLIDLAHILNEAENPTALLAALNEQYSQTGPDSLS